MAIRKSWTPTSRTTWMLFHSAPRLMRLVSKAAYRAYPSVYYD